MMQHIINIIIICLLAATGYSQSSEMIDFTIENIQTVNKIVITEKEGKVFTLTKGGGRWTDDKGNCVIQENVGFILDAFEKIEFKGYLPENMIENYSNRDSITRVKIDIYQNNEWIKTWYIGPPTAEHNGQIMFLKSKNSNGYLPVITKMRGLVGIIEPRFFSDHKKWRCTTIFAISPEEIASIKVTNLENQKKSFRVIISQNDIQVFNDTNRLSISDTAAVYRYLSRYKKLNFERYDDQLTPIQIDSLKATHPFLILELMDKKGFCKTLYCYRKTDKISDKIFDEDRFWCILLPYNELVICQYFIFNALFEGEYYFPISTNIEK